MKTVRSERFSHFKICKGCNLYIDSREVAWHQPADGTYRKYSGWCKKCHPDFWRVCSSCGSNKRIEEFQHGQRSLKKPKCKICKPYIRTERQKAYTRARQKDPQYRKRASEYANKRNKERAKTDIQFRLKKNLRTRLYCFLKGKIKSGSAVRDLGCTLPQLIDHFERQFKPGMSWENYGNKSGQWSIDHILPMSKFDLTDRKQLLTCCNYKNLQPMWHLENISKGNKSNL